MANIFSATVLQVNQYATTTGGVVYALPTTGIVVTPSSAVVNGTPASSAITVPPTGLNQRSTTYLTTSTVAAVVTAANA